MAEKDDEKLPVDAETSVDEKEVPRKKRSHAWRNLSYTTRVTLSFAAIAAMTALVAIGVVSFVWEQHFQTYTRENMQDVAETTAEQIAAQYERDGSFTPTVLQRARNMVNVTKGIGMPNRTSMTVVMYLNNYLTTSKNYGMAGAVSVVLFIISAALSLVVYSSLSRQYRKPAKHRKY